MKANLRYIFVLFVFILSVNSEEWTCGTNCKATLENNVLKITGSGKIRDFNKRSVPWIGNKSSIKSIVIEEGITTIGNSVFQETNSLTSVILSNSVTTICDWAFAHCYNLKYISIPNSATTIDRNAFYQCSSLTSGSIGSIKWNLNKETGELSFTGEGKMKDFVDSGARPWDKSRSSVKKVTISEGITNIGDYTFSYCSLTSIVIPNNVKTIGDNAFYGCSKLTSLTIPNDVTAIGEYAFYGCSKLTSLTTPNSVTTIGEGAFSWCSSLASIIIPDSVIAIGNNAFSSCSQLESPSIPSSVKVIGISAFYKCPEWKSGTLGGIEWTLNDNGELNFSGSGNMPNFYPGGVPWYSSYLSIKTVKFEGEITSIGDYAFYGCDNLEKVTLPSTVTSIGFNANVNEEDIPADIKRPMLCGMDCLAYFSDDVLKIEGSGEMTDFSDKSDLSNSQITAPWYSVKDSIKEVEISEGITTIGRYAFYKSSLTSITIPNNVTTIGGSAFHDCSSLTSGLVGTIKWNLSKEAREMSFTGEGKMKDFEYSSARPWDASKDSIEKVTISKGITNIGDGVFLGCSNMVSIILPTNIESIGAAAFKGCSSLSSEINLQNVEIIPTEAFSGCTMLTSIVLSETVQLIGKAAFKDCGNLDSEIQLNALSSIEPELFSGCKKLKKISISSSSSSTREADKEFTIGNAAFSGCSELTELILPETVTEIGDDAFNGCANLSSSLSFNLLASIGENAFKDCSSVTTLNIGEKVESVSANAFSGCSELKELTLPETVTTIGNYAFNGCAKLSSISVVDENHEFQSIDGVLFKKGKPFTLLKYPPYKGNKEYEIPSNVTSIREGAFTDCDNLDTVKFCGKLDNYRSSNVVTGKKFKVVVSSKFEDDFFYGIQVKKDLTEEECPRDVITIHSNSSSKSNVGMIVGCVCGVVALSVFVVIAVWFRMTSKSKKKDVELEKFLQELNGTLSKVFFDKNYVKRYKEFQANKHDRVKEIELVGSLVECDKQVVSFNQSEDVANLLMLGTNYRSDFTLTNISEEELKLSFFISGCAEPHEVVFEPAHISLSKRSSKRVIVSVKFRCSANLSPEKVKICGEIEKTGEWGAICGMEANTDITRIISCDDLSVGSELIGSGSYANVYLGNLKKETVAVKAYKSFSEANNIEAQNFAKFNSLYIVKLYGVCYSLNALVLEYCPYGSIEACYGNPELDEEVKKMACYDLAKAMNYLHESNFIHRDLKPDNLLMVSFSHDLEKPRGKLSDFGTSQTALKKTKLKSIEGTPAFLAPEVLTGQYDKQCDVYSFGLSAWSILNEMFPYEDSHFNGVKTEEEFYQLIADGVRPSLDAVGTWRELIEKCWQQSPDLRPDFGSILQMIEKEFGEHIETPASSDKNDNMLSKTKVMDGEELNKTKVQDVDLNKTKN